MLWGTFLTYTLFLLKSRSRDLSQETVLDGQQEYTKQEGSTRIQIAIKILRTYYVQEMMRKFINLAYSAIV